MRFRFYSTRREKRDVGVSFVLSMVLHLLLLLLFFIVALIGSREARLPEEPRRDQRMEITFVEPLPTPPPPEPEPEPEVEPVFVDATGMEEAVEPPEETRFESHLDTVAAGELPPTTDSDLPTVDGRDEPHFEVAEQRHTLGPDTAQVAEAAPEAPQPPQPEIPPEPAPEEPTEQTEPTEPEEVPEEIPEPEDLLAMLDTERVITELPPPPPDAFELRPPPQVRRAEPIAPDHVRQEVRRAETSSTRPPSSPGYQPERRATRIEGGVSNLGRPSVAARATPLGRYQKMLSDAIGSRWYFYVSNEISLLAVGTTTIRFQVDPSGRVSGIQVLSNSSNESFASVSIRSILEADIPPIPPEVAEHLENNRIEVDYTFSILAN